MKNFENPACVKEMTNIRYVPPRIPLKLGVCGQMQSTISPLLGCCPFSSFGNFSCLAFQSEFRQAQFHPAHFLSCLLHLICILSVRQEQLLLLLLGGHRRLCISLPHAIMGDRQTDRQRQLAREREARPTKPKPTRKKTGGRERYFEISFIR